MIVWLGTLYFAQGLPNAIVDLVAPVALKDLNFDNALITFIAAWAYLPWVLKALWAPLVDAFGTKRSWIAGTQFAQALTFLSLGFFIADGVPALFAVAAFFLTAVLSATYDIAADGFYMLALDDRKQAFYSGTRNLFFRLSQVFAKGGIIVLAGMLVANGNSPETSWRIVFAGTGILTALFAAIHFFTLPFPEKDLPAAGGRFGGNALLLNFFETWKTFFQKKNIVSAIVFLLLFRFGEVQLGAVSPLFLKDPLEKGGLALDNLAVGTLYGTFGVISLIAGGILGGVVVAGTKRGLAFWLLPMAAALNLPDFVYTAFAHWQTQSFPTLAAGIAVEQFGYGFGFTGYMLFMLKFSAGTRHAAAHYAICTAFMALSVFLPKIWSGALQNFLGYENFFWWAILCTVPGFVIAAVAAKQMAHTRKEFPENGGNAGRTQG